MNPFRLIPKRARTITLHRDCKKNAQQHSKPIHPRIRSLPLRSPPDIQAGFSLLELSLSLAILAILLATWIPLQHTLAQRNRDWRDTFQTDQWISQIEGFAITHQRLPCPATDADGAEGLNSPAGPCMQTTGLLPWRSMGLPRPDRTPLYAVASLEILGTPYAHVLTRQAGVRDVPMDLLSAAIFAPPDTAGSSPGTLPALLVKSTGVADPIGGTQLPGVACQGSVFLTVSAVALVSGDASQAPLFSNGNRCYLPPAAGQQRLMVWLSYERLMWLHLRAGNVGAS